MLFKESGESQFENQSMPSPEKLKADIESSREIKGPQERKEELAETRNNLRLEQIREELEIIQKSSAAGGTEKINGISSKEQKTETVTIAGKQYTVNYVSKNEIYPAFGLSRGATARVREDLPPRIKNFVKTHELYHCRDRAKWGGWLGRELRANLIPGLKDPIGLLATVWATISDIDRIRFYWERFKKGR